MVEPTGTAGAAGAAADPVDEQEPRPENRLRDVAGKIGGFVSQFGGAPNETTAVIENLGNRGARIVLVAADGRWGEVIASSPELAEQACAASGVSVGEWDRALSARLRITPADWRRMAGL